MAERTLTYFVADVHLGLDLADPLDREARFVEFLRSIPRERTEALYMLGDIWDFWFEYRDVVPKGYVRVFGALCELMDAGVQVHFFPGNHDMWCFHYFESLGIQVHEQPYVVKISGKTFCLGHGDGLGPVPFGYRFLRGVFRCRFLQVLFSTLHPTIAFSIGRAWSRNKRASRMDYVFRGADEALYKWAEDYSESNQVDYFIFGHYHSPFDLRLRSGARLLVSDSWLRSTPFMYFDGMDVFTGISQKSEK